MDNMNRNIQLLAIALQSVSPPNLGCPDISKLKNIRGAKLKLTRKKDIEDR